MKKEREDLHHKVAELEIKCERLEKNLQQSEERFFKVFHASSNMMAIHTVREGRFVDLNEAAASLGGFKREDLIGHTMADHGLLEDPSLTELVNQKLQQEGKAHNLEMKVRTKDGDMHTVLFSADPITLDNEPCMLAVSVDVTEQEEKAEAFEQAKNYLNQIINCSGDPIFVKDRAHKFVLVNDALTSLTGHRREELLGETALELLPQNLAQSVWEHEEEVFTTGKQSLTEDNFIDRQGNSHIVMTKQSLLIDKSGKKQIVGVLRDITEYKRLEAQFLQAQKMEAIGALAGGVAHDFNNLLSVINGYCELTLDDLAQDNPTRGNIKLIKEAGQRAASLTSQLLAFGRKQILQPEILNLNDIITQMSPMLRRMIRESIELIAITQPYLGRINADPVQIQQIVMNLAVNARDAMLKGGNLTIETANVHFDEEYVRNHPEVRAGSYVMLAISDNGVGMDVATQARIFEPFFTTKGKGKGTGLGLATVYGIVKQSNGFIWVYSEPGKGTTFKIYFPRFDGDVSDLTEESKSQQEAQGVETVLIAEDEPSVLALAAQILRGRGYTALEAASGKKALDIAEKYAGEIHLVLTDVVMPGISGRELVSRLEAMRPGIKSLYFSGYTDNAIVHHGILDSGVAFLQKPFTVEGLARKVREVLNS